MNSLCKFNIYKLFSRINLNEGLHAKWWHNFVVAKAGLQEQLFPFFLVSLFSSYENHHQCIKEELCSANIMFILLLIYHYVYDNYLSFLTFACKSLFASFQYVDTFRITPIMQNTLSNNSYNNQNWGFHNFNFFKIQLT